MFLLSTSENILLFVSGFGLLQGIFSAALLYLHSKSDRSVNGFLSLYILTLTVPIILPLVQYLFSWQVITFLEPVLALIPAFLYLYICSFKEVITFKKAWPHFVFFFVCVALAFVVYIVIGSKSPASEKIPDEARKNLLLLVPFSTRLVQRIIYYFLSRKALRNYQRSIMHLFSDTSRINLNWIKWLINGFLFLIIISLVAYFIMLRYPQYIDRCVLICGVIVALYMYMATFKGLTQNTLWQIHPHITKETMATEINKVKQVQNTDNKQSLSSQKNRMADYRISEIATHILALMENEKLYQEPDLTLQNLAEKLQFPSYQVSQAINEGMKKSFYDLVNGYRVEEAKRLLLDPKNKDYTILSVGFEAGFNSKTTFNTVFKKFTGLTPTDYREIQGKLALAG